MSISIRQYKSLFWLDKIMSETFGRYVILNEIGKGSSGIVYRGRDPLMDRIVAIKTIHHKSLEGNDQEKIERFLKRFYREARASGILSHPNVVTIFDIGEEDGIPYIAMEYIDGQTLSDVMKEIRLIDKGLVLKILKQVADALDYAHSKGIIHRDVKPSNIMYCQNEFIKVMDFSIARLEMPDMGTITTSGTILGTPFYMPPEQILGDKTTNKSDVYSLGVVAYEILTGSLPFPGSSITSIIYKVLHEKPIMHKKLLDLAKSSTAWEDCFLRVLAKDPEQRFQTATEFIDNLVNHFHLEKVPRLNKSIKTSEFDGHQETRLLSVSLREKAVNPFKDNIEKTTLLPFDYKSATRSQKETAESTSDYLKPMKRLDNNPDFQSSQKYEVQQVTPWRMFLLVMSLLILLCLIYIILAQLFPSLRIIDLPYFVKGEDMSDVIVSSIVKSSGMVIRV